MAIFSKKEDDKEKATAQLAAEDAAAEAEPAQEEASGDTPAVMIDVDSNELGSKGLIVPRTSEKAGMLGNLKKYVFTVHGKLNKVEVRNAVEDMYGVKVSGVNMITNKPKKRRYGRIEGNRSGFKKAVVTLTPDSKDINFVEPN